MNIIDTPTRGARTPAQFAAGRRIRRAISQAGGGGVGRALRHLGPEEVAGVLTGDEPFGRACLERATAAGRGPDLEAWAVVSTCPPEEVRRRLARSGVAVPPRPRRQARRHSRQGPQGVSGPASFGPEPGPAPWQIELAQRAEGLGEGDSASTPVLR